MKKLLLLPVVFCLALPAMAQLKTTAVCPPFSIDVLDGKINELYISSTLGEFKKAFPCYTSAEEETAAAKCGGGIFFNDKGLYCYTGRDYVEIREKFTGKLSVPLMGASRNGLFKWLGNPQIKDVNWDAYQTAYGILVVYYNKSGKVNKLIMSTKSSSSLQICE